MIKVILQSLFFTIEFNAISSLSFNYDEIKFFDITRIYDKLCYCSYTILNL